MKEKLFFLKNYFFLCPKKGEIIEMNNAKNISIAVNLSVFIYQKINIAANKNPVKFYNIRIPQTSKL